MYAEFYGFSGEPFLLTPDQRFYFESRVHGQAMAHLMYGVTRGEGFIVITGEVGAGKTTLLHRLCSTIDTDRIVVAQITTTHLSGAELLRMVCAEFKLGNIPSEKDAALTLLKNHFESLYRDGRRALLIVDEAQNLSASVLEELRMLSNFQLGAHSLCQTFLVGQPQFRTTLGHPDLEQFRQRVIATYHLGPMGPEECVLYLEHRLKQVGWNGDPTFEQEAIDELAAQTGGVPRKINTFCSRLLLLGFLDDLHCFSATHVRRIATDLRAESGVAPLAVVRAEGEHALANESAYPPGLRGRVETLEQRVDQQERSLRRVVSVLTDFADLVSGGRGR